MTRLRSALVALCWAPVLAPAQVRTTIIVQVDNAPTWRDMVYLAAIPAAEAVNKGGGSIISLDESCLIGPEIRDYADRYHPNSVVAVASRENSKSIEASWRNLGVPVSTILSASAEDTAVLLSRRFWKTSSMAVVVSDQDYESALVGASLASLQNVPMLFVPDRVSGIQTATELKRLGVNKVLFVGSEAPKLSCSVVKLPNAVDVIAWVRGQNKTIKYLAVVNPLDRTNFLTRKLSMVGAQLASGRHGLVIPLNMATQWKRPFPTNSWVGPLPTGIPASQVPVQAGKLSVDGEKIPFLLTGKSEDEGLRITLDRSGKGRYSESFVSGDTLEVAGRRWAVSLGKRTKFGTTSVHLTWPTADEIRTRLEKYYALLKAPPDHLCLVGFPDALPHAIIGHGGIVEEQTSDLPFALVSGSQFAQIGVARLIAESLSYGTLYAARAITYPDLQREGWAMNAVQAEWENKLGPLFQNVGFKKPFQFTHGAQESKLGHCALLTHSEHSSWQSLGTMLGWDAKVQLAPTVIESSGCSTASLDRDPNNRSVIARLLRLGALSFSGGSRELPAQVQPLRMEFWNGILAGETLGQAYKRALNAGILSSFEGSEGPEGIYRYCTQVYMQFGDPALAIQIPTAPRSRPAHTIIKGDVVTVVAPDEWSILKGVVPPDWKMWAGKDLFYVRGPGSFAMSNWISDGRDQETALVKAEFNLGRKITNIELLSRPRSPLGWSGKWYEQVNPNGTITYRFLVRMIDFDPVRGKILSHVDRLDFKLTYQ